jgi:hypothetical protein
MMQLICSKNTEYKIIDDGTDSTKLYFTEKCASSPLACTGRRCSFVSRRMSFLIIAPRTELLCYHENCVCKQRFL